MLQYPSRDRTSNRYRTIAYYLMLSIIATLVLLLVSLSIKGISLVSGQAPPGPERKYEIGDVARFVAAGGLVHQGPIVDYRLDPNNRWVYDIAFPGAVGEASVWENLEEFRILLVDEASAPYHPRVEGYPVRLADPITGETVDGDVTEGIVTGGREIGGIWNYHLLVLGCEEILPPEGLTIVLIDTLVEPFTCTPEPEPAPTEEPPEEPTEEPDGTDGVTGSDTVEP